jgi:hypothetical protein
MKYFRSQITFFYSSSQAVVNSSFASGTLRELFDNSTGIMLTEKARKGNVLDLFVKVDYPPRKDETDEEVLYTV